MIVNDVIYTSCNVVNVKTLIELIRQNKCPDYYFVYKTCNKNFLFQIGAYNTLKLEKDMPVILGVSDTKESALKITCYLLKKLLIPEDK